MALPILLETALVGRRGADPIYETMSLCPDSSKDLPMNSKLPLNLDDLLRQRTVEGERSHRVRVEFVKLNRDLRTDGPAFREEIGKILGINKAV